MFIGQYQSSFKVNNQLEIPANFQNLLSGQVVITQGFERNILILPVEVFQDLSRLVMALNIADPLARGLMRMLLGNAQYSEIDSSGLISLPDRLKEFAGLIGDVVLIGQGKYIEIWSGDAWHKQSQDLQDVEANSQRFASLSLAGF